MSHGLIKKKMSEQNKMLELKTLALQTDADLGSNSRAPAYAWHASRNNRRPVQAVPSCSKTFADGLPSATTRFNKSRPAAKSFDASLSFASRVSASEHVGSIPRTHSSWETAAEGFERASSAFSFYKK